MAFDPDEFLGDKKKETTESGVRQDGFNVDQFLASTDSTGSQPALVAETSALPPDMLKGSEELAASLAQTALSTGLSQGDTGLTNLARAGVKAAAPFTQAAIGPTAAIYKAHPLLSSAIDAAGLATFGVPPVAASQSAMGLYDKYKGALAAGKEGSKFLSQGAPDVAGKPITIEPYQNLRDSLRKAGAGELYDDVMRTASKPGGGGNNAVLSGLQNNQKFQALLASNPEVASAFKSYSGAVPGVMGQIGRVAGPVLRGAAKIAGPVGMGLNMYDAGQMARQTELGPRLAQGQGQQAEAAFRAGPVQSYQGPQLSAQEQQNVMQSGSARDRQYFDDQINMAIRLKAARKVLGQP